MTGRGDASRAALMKETLAEGLSELRGRTVRIHELRCEAFDGSSSFAAERLHVKADDEWLEVFFKDLNPMHQLADAKLIRQPELERSRRELHVYRSILRGGRLGTPLLYGSRWEPQCGRLWLFLEYAGPKRLSRLGDLGLWIEASRWAGRFHVASREFPRDAVDVLPQHDPETYSRCASELHDRLGRFSMEHRRTLESALLRYEDEIPSLRELPHGLIHNEFFGKNVIIRNEESSGRISVIDWETARIGAHYLDLTSISAGRWTGEQRAAMWRAYADQVERDSGESIDWRDFCNAMRAVALYQSLSWLNWWSSGDDVHINRWMKELRTVLEAYGQRPAGKVPQATGPALPGTAVLE